MTPLEALEKGLNNVTWAQVWAGVVFVLLNIGAASVAVYRAAKQATGARDYIEKMATNDLPHTFRALVNIDANIAKLSGGNPVNWDAANIEIQMLKK